jgi:hypothetical protein
MKEIKPTYITFEQAKWLKEKGYEIDTDEILFCRDEINNIEEHQLKNRDVIYNATSINYKVGENEYRIYHQWEFVEWLRVNHGIWVEVRYYEFYKVFIYEIVGLNNGKGTTSKGISHFYSPQEAYSAAFNYIFNNNLI